VKLRARPITGESGTREAVARLILERGPLSAADLARTLGISPAGVRRHLDMLLREELIAPCPWPAPAPGSVLGSVQHGRGPGRPARRYQVTDAGRAEFPHAYDDLATSALRYLHDTCGDAAVADFATRRAERLLSTLTPDVTAQVLALALTEQGYVATVEPTGAGVQICQHHCPVAHVAAEFPQLCEAETRAFEKLLGTNVQRLATIAHGDRVCTTHVATGPYLSSPAVSSTSSTTSLTATPAQQGSTT
jgi:predicted ArsR family transcriptional regulator